ncbi:uncharacterized protein LOC117738601 [Cyclopterus lumpus]|uniref:uncharacterized protein LOC117738601 n=1 Tax=Cyclopterus lumpus TaxID=8103 RepID=UPI0014870FA6|nr:uncharacterized protein LOC117738601 [Cyclopterus lumpus]
MNLWLSTHFLVAGLFLSSWALTPEECRPLITPLSMTPSMIYGKSHFLFGYTDNEVYNGFMKNIESYWNNVIPSTFGPNALNVSTENKLNGTCLSLNMNATVEDNTLIMKFDNFTSLNHMLPTCDGCLLYSFNRTFRNMDNMYHRMRLAAYATSEEHIMSGLHLFARGTTLKDSELEHFRKQASCLGFNREPDFIYDPKNDFCAEGEGLKIHKNVSGNDVKMIDEEQKSLDMSICY